MHKRPPACGWYKHYGRQAAEPGTEFGEQIVPQLWSDSSISHASQRSIRLSHCSSKSRTISSHEGLFSPFPANLRPSFPVQTSHLTADFTSAKTNSQKQLAKTNGFASDRTVPFGFFSGESRHAPSVPVNNYVSPFPSTNSKIFLHRRSRSTHITPLDLILRYSGALIPV